MTDYIPPMGDRSVSFRGVPVLPKPQNYRGDIQADLKGTFRPICGMVLIELDEASAFYDGTNILMPQEYRDVAEYGVVRAVGGGVYVGGNENGTGARHYPLTLKVGDRVRLRRWNMTELMLNDRLHVVQPEADVLWKVEDAMKDTERRYGKDVVPVVGDVVRQSGAEQYMTVESSKDGQVHCKWFVGEKLHEETFPEGGLIRVTQAPELVVVPSPRRPRRSHA